MHDTTTEQKNALPRVTLVGRVNVGKSTLFNRLTESHKALVSPVAGTTRTRNESEVLWRGKRFLLTDTGGLAIDEGVELREEIIKQTNAAMYESNMIVFVVDGQVGILPEDRALAKRIREMQRPILLLVNKIDSDGDELRARHMPWRALGCGDPLFIAGKSSRGAGDTLETIFKILQKTSTRPKITKDRKTAPITVAIIGKPNVGKSSLFNKLIGEDRVIVSSLPHTTREPYDTVLSYKEKQGEKEVSHTVVLVDTAGIRRKNAIEGGTLESAGVRKSLAMMQRADIVLLVLDATEPYSAQDKQLARLLEFKAKSVIILLNKWDLIETNEDSYRNEVKQMTYAHFPHLSFAPIIFVSGKTKYKVQQIMPAIIDAWRGRHVQIPDETLFDWMRSIKKTHKPSRGKGTRHPDIMSLRQTAVNPPIFEMVIKYRTSLHRSYIQFIENRLRESFNFSASPVLIKLRKQKK